METGAEHGMYTWQRYQAWLETRKTWYSRHPDEQPDSDPVETAPVSATPPPIRPAAQPPHPETRPPSSPAGPAGSPAKRIEIEPVEGGLEELIKKLE